MSIRNYSVPNIFLWLVWPAGILTLMVFMFLTCTGRNVQAQGDAENKDEAKSKSINASSNTPLTAFPAVDIPAMLTDPDSRAAYLATHYWDRFDFADTTLIHLPEITEQGFVNYLSVLPHTDNGTAAASIKAMLKTSITRDKTGTVYRYLLDKYKDYLYDPNSPFRNEEYYIAVTGQILEDSVSDEATKSRADFDLKLMAKNRVGTPATDFSYLTIDNKKGTLYKLKKNYTLVYFNNPDCRACKEVTAYLSNSPLIHHLLKKGMLDILAVYPDEDVALWQEYQGEIAANWINVRDVSKIKDKLAYDLKAIPCLYLLDKDKKVLLKDAGVREVETKLEQITMNNEQ